LGSPAADLETLMTVFRNIVALATGICAIATASPPATAMPTAASRLPNPSPVVEQAQIFQRGRPPIYPYYYVPPRGPRGWSFYFGPVPYAKGDFETQALQRVYPQLNYPPSMRYWTPQSG